MMPGLETKYLLINEMDNGIRPTAHELMNSNRNKTREKAKRFECVVQRVFNQISIKGRDENWTRMVYTIPPYVLGMPIYDLDLCMRYVVNKLQSSGYYVEIFPPNVIYISWDKSEI